MDEDEISRALPNCLSDATLERLPKNGRERHGDAASRHSFSRQELSIDELHGKKGRSATREDLTLA